MHVPLFHTAPITLVLHYLDKTAALEPSLMLLTLGSSSAYNTSKQPASPLRAIALVLQAGSLVLYQHGNSGSQPEPLGHPQPPHWLTGQLKLEASPCLSLQE